ncbi:MAG: LysR family transcriptional regulator [Chitinophagaceae bacterium]|nr:MAG: LysR family transcriptional regulator [Chitinophagaceae bacterium]
MPSKELRNVLVATNKYQVKGTLWIECNGQRYFGPGPAELLQHISTTGSIRQAAMQMGMSYKKAWHMVNMLNENTASPMVIPQTGGSKGGGSVVTEEAKTMIAWHMELRDRFSRFLESESLNM